jgi:hypothetical protein
VGILGGFGVVVLGGWQLTLPVATLPMDIATTFRIPLYPCRLTVHICERIDLSVAKAHKEPVEGKLEDNAALTTSGSGRFHVYFRPESISHGLIAHELFHITSGMLSHVGHKPIDGQNEAEAYLCGWLADRIYKFLNKRDILIK